MEIRKPVVAGQFYPADASELKQTIKESFLSELGPGAEPGKRGSGRVLGVVTPHAGYVYSGAGAAHVFKEIGETQFADTYVILGVNHSGPVTCVSSEDWKTPLGVVKTDSEFVKSLVEKGLPVDDSAHHQEHSIEVQLPFLQTVSKDRLDDLRIACIMIADGDYSKWGKMILDVAESLKRKICVICSSDFTHHGLHYGFIPFKSDLSKNMKEFDGKAIDMIIANDAEGFVKYVDMTRATICGRYGIAVLCWMMKQKKGKGELLKYYTSAEVMCDRCNAVGYASIVFRPA